MHGLSSIMAKSAWPDRALQSTLHLVHHTGCICLAHQELEILLLLILLLLVVVLLLLVVIVRNAAAIMQDVGLPDKPQAKLIGKEC